MKIFGLPQSPTVGFFASNLKQAIKDCEIEDTREAALAYLIDLAEKNGIPVAEYPAELSPENS